MCQLKGFSMTPSSHICNPQCDSVQFNRGRAASLITWTNEEIKHGAPQFDKPHSTQCPSTSPVTSSWSLAPICLLPFNCSRPGCALALRARVSLPSLLSGVVAGDDAPWSLVAASVSQLCPISILELFPTCPMGPALGVSCLFFSLSSVRGPVAPSPCARAGFAALDVTWNGY